MSPLRIIICEDEPIAQEVLSSLLRQCAIPSSQTVFSSGVALLEAYYPGCCDLILMDIIMDGLSGVETVARIRSKDPDVSIAFLTSSPDFTMEGYRHRVDRYLLKPVEKEELEEALELAARNRKHQPAITLTIQKREQTVPHAHILFAEQQGHALNLHLTSGEILRTTMKLTTLNKMLPTPPFYHCHKSFLVNLAQVRYLDDDLRAFVMSDGSAAYIRRDSLRQAREMYSQYMFDPVREQMDS